MKRLLPVIVALLAVGWLLLDRGERARGPARGAESAGRPSNAPAESPAAPAPAEVPGALAGFTLNELGVLGGWRVVRPTTGRPVVLPGEPERIVSQSLATDEALLAMVPARRLVAVSRLATDPRYSLAIAEATAIGSWVTSNAEQILSLRPDLVFLASYTTPETVRQLKGAQARVIQLTRFDSIAAVRDNLRVVGFAVGADRATRRLLDTMDRRLDDAAARTRRKLAGRHPRVAAWDDGVVPGTATIFDDAVRRLGGENAAATEGLEGWPKVTVEGLAAWQLDLLFVPYDPGAEAAVRSSLLAQPVLAASSAVRSGGLVLVPRAVFGTVSQHVTTLVERMAAAFEGWAESR